MQTKSITTEWRVPSTYQEVAWIGRNGNNYIDTGRVPKQTVPFEVQIGYKISTSGVRYGVLSNYDGQNNHSISFEINSGSDSSNKARFFTDTSSGSDLEMFSSNSLNLSSFNDIKFKSNQNNSGTIILNGTTSNGTIDTSGYYNANAYLFIDRQLRRSTFNHDSSVSYLKIYENGTLKKDFIPCYRKSDNVIGFWERIGKQFYTNKGSGTFSKGGNV